MQLLHPIPSRPPRIRDVSNSGFSSAVALGTIGNAQRSTGRHKYHATGLDLSAINLETIGH